MANGFKKRQKTKRTGPAALTEEEKQNITTGDNTTDNTTDPDTPYA